MNYDIELDEDTNWFKMILNYQMMVGGTQPNGVVGGLIPDCKIVSLLDGKLTKWSSASCVPPPQKKG